MSWMCVPGRADRGAVLAAELKELLEVLFYPHGSLSSETLSPTHLARVTGEDTQHT